MGNSLVSMPPSQVLSVETFLNDVNQYKYDKSLGSTRFMKVARASCTEGWVVIKVFILPEAKYDLEKHKKELMLLRENLAQSSNCLPMKKFHTTDKAAFLVRQFIKHNLYDRLSTRPFYKEIDRKWVTFQLLCALNQLANVNICHGDIKSENVTLTSWNWLMLTDFACYKPVKLPSNNPANFNYFYDTARRRTCYIAPERFVANTQESYGGRLNPAHDIFAAGCVIAEIFTDGACMFDLSQLLAYKSGTTDRKEVLDQIQDKHVRKLVKSMIELDPKKRKTAEQYLLEYKGIIFPDIFYTFLKHYLGKFCENPQQSADDTIMTLFNNQDEIFAQVKYHKDGSAAVSILTSLLLSCVRNLSYCVTKLNMLELVEKFSSYLPNEDIMERIVPYLVSLLRDSTPRIRSRVLDTLAMCLSNVSSISKHEVPVFGEFIFPSLDRCCKDEDSLVRQAYAKFISVYTNKALQCLNQNQEEPTQSDDNNLSSLNMNREYDSLISFLRHHIGKVMSDAESSIKRILLDKSMAPLCKFFGKNRANDFLLSHMITVLNNQQDWQLRAAFFSTLVPVCSYIGWQASNILPPLLTQGLNDKEDFVIATTLTTSEQLAKLGLLTKDLMNILLCNCVPYLAHPCKWIRLNTVGFISACAKLLNPVDHHCFLLPLLSTYIEGEVLQLHNTIILMSALRPPLSYDVYSMICNSKDLENFFSHLKYHVEYGQVNNSANTSSLLMSKLLAKKLSSYELEALLQLEKHIIKRHKDLQSKQNDLEDEDHRKGEIDLKKLYKKTGRLRRHADLRPSLKSGENKRNMNNRRVGQGLEQNQELNEEWKTMFGSSSSSSKPPSHHPHVTKSTSNVSSPAISMSQLEVADVQDLTDTTKKAPNNVTYPECMRGLRTLVHRKRNNYSLSVEQKHLDDYANHKMSNLSKIWKPKGVLLSRMTEHSGCINKVVTSSSNNYFVTASSDRTLKLWEPQEFERKMVVNRSRATCSHFGGALKCLAFCGDNDVICSSDDGMLHLINLTKMSARSSEMPDFESHTPVMKKIAVNKSECGSITDIQSLFASNLFIYITSFGNIVAIDRRSWKTAYQFQQDTQYGLPLSLCTDYAHNWLCTGTSQGTHVCWDLRFQIPISRFRHCSCSRIRKLIRHPSKPSSILSAVDGNNEVDEWNIEQGTKDLVLWGSSTSPISMTHKSSDTVNGMHANMTNNGLHVFTAGNDGRIRLWQTETASESRIICGPELNKSPQVSYTVEYESRLVDGLDIIQERITKIKQTLSDVQTLSGNINPQEELFIKGSKREHGEHNIPVHNRQIFTDLAIYEGNQRSLITTSSTGVISIWL